MSSSAFDAIEIGMPVYDSTGEKVGVVDGLDRPENTLIIRKGLLIPGDVAIPLGAVERVGADGVHLGVTRADVADQNWTAAAAASAATTPGLLASESTGEPAEAEAETADPASAERVDEAAASAPPVHSADPDPARAFAPSSGGDMESRPRAASASRAIYPSALDPEAFRDRDFEFALMGERIIPRKHARIAQELRLYKTAITEQRRITGTVRREQAHVEAADASGGFAAAPRADLTAPGEPDEGQLPSGG